MYVLLQRVVKQGNWQRIDVLYNDGWVKELSFLSKNNATGDNFGHANPHKVSTSGSDLLSPYR